ncbi:hypothetical protein EJ05DRAFT_537228 [Pseudovirgaria hyperparasitica]|uniref:Uncharacterized protein n=1 Tax=Pseudovirgaria hyperparasitica TaxID=470096 RepID=A0A6A6WDL5_9PEZI|nr:uncharacterized protein EJ05DRAFT_537228 [Pseudovirgaria hyperparasitica]KAF2760060.1 hypothetical protein EJ05DRAFT_537228 [Pseudovirgaria hyperparasitica]
MKLRSQESVPIARSPNHKVSQKMTRSASETKHARLAKASTTPSPESSKEIVKCTINTEAHISNTPKPTTPSQASAATKITSTKAPAQRRSSSPKFAVEAKASIRNDTEPTDKTVAKSTAEADGRSVTAREPLSRSSSLKPTPKNSTSTVEPTRSIKNTAQLPGAPAGRLIEYSLWWRCPRGHANKTTALSDFDLFDQDDYFTCSRRIGNRGRCERGFMHRPHVLGFSPSSERAVTEELAGDDDETVLSTSTLVRETTATEGRETVTTVRAAAGQPVVVERRTLHLDGDGFLEWRVDGEGSAGVAVPHQPACALTHSQQPDTRLTAPVGPDSELAGEHLSVETREEIRKCGSQEAVSMSAAPAAFVLGKRGRDAAGPTQYSLRKRRRVVGDKEDSGEEVVLGLDSQGLDGAYWKS